MEKQEKSHKTHKAQEDEKALKPNLGLVILLSGQNSATKNSGQSENLKLLVTKGGYTVHCTRYRVLKYHWKNGTCDSGKEMV